MTPSDQAPRDLVGFLDFYLVQRAPFQIPAEIRELLVKFGPWIAVVLLVLSVPGLLLVLGLGTVLLPFGVGYDSGFGFHAVAFLAQIALLVFALPGLFTRKQSAWKLLLYSQLIGIAASLLAGNLIWAIVGGLIGLYLLFQIRMLYVN